VTDRRRHRIGAVGAAGPQDTGDMQDPVLESRSPEIGVPVTPVPPAAPAATAPRGLALAQGLLYGGVVGMMVGSFLPWMSLQGTSFGGVSGDGLLTLPLGIVAGPLAFLAVRGARWAGVTLVAVAVIAGFVVVYDTAQITGSSLTIGVGVPLCGLATLALIAGALQTLRIHPRPPWGP